MVYRFFSTLVLGLILLLARSQPAKAQYYNTFGVNKVQYAQFNWHVMQTPHFDLYYYPEEDELVRTAAAMAERSYRFLQQKFGHSLFQRIPLIIYSTHIHFEETNTIPFLLPENVGAFFEFIKGRVVIPYDGSLYTFDRTLRHELVHVFTTHKIRSVMRNHRRLLTSSPPLWFTEGLADYWGEDWDTQADMFIRDAILSGYLVPIPQIYRILGSFLMYKEGQSFMRFLAEHYGEDKIVLLLNNWWRANRFEDLVRITFDQSVEQLSEEWIYSLKKTYFPHMEKNDMPSKVASKLTHRGINVKPVYIPAAADSSSGPGVVFMSNRMGYSDIYLKPLDSPKAEPKLLVRGGRTSHFESLHFLRSKMSVTPDHRLVFVSKSEAQDVLYCLNIDTQTIEARFKFDQIVAMSSPSWSPDGTQIAFSGLTWSGYSDLYLVDYPSRQLQRLTNDLYSDRDPAWSADGKSLVFSSDRTEQGEDGHNNLFIYDLTSHRIRYLTQSPYNDLAPAWSPDGRWIAFVSDRHGGPNLFLISAPQSPAVLADQSAALTPAPWSQYNGLAMPQLATGRTDDRVNPDRPAQDFKGVHDRPETAPSRRSAPPSEVYQLTHLLTGAFDPAWTEDGNTLLFTGFQDFSFQLYRFTLPDLDTLMAEPRTDFDKRLAHWQAPQIEAQKVITNVKYKPKYSLDIAQGEIGQTTTPDVGVEGGLLVSMSDILGNTRYTLLFSNSAQTQGELLKNTNFYLARVDLSHRLNYGFGVFHVGGQFFNPRDGFFEERRYGIQLLTSYPFSKFRRLETSIGLMNSDRTWGGHASRQAILVTNEISFVHDATLWGPAGPLDGGRHKWTLSYATDFSNTTIHYATFIGDYRKYFRLSRRVSHGLRILGIFSRGREPQLVRAGGSWDFRGYPFRSLFGENLFLINNELRFPFMDLLHLGFPFVPLRLAGIRGALFLDVGNVWLDDFGEVLGSFGGGFRWSLGGGFVLRLDLAKTTNFRRLDNGLKVQFFFGPNF